MQHRGEIVEKAVRESGFSLTKLAQRMGKSRKWLYDAFENPNLSIEFVLVSEDQAYSNQSHQDEIAFWKDKYIQVLEENKRLLERLAQLD
jgi:lambda repressor-like predicted transcriptional regulator